MKSFGPSDENFGQGRFLLTAVLLGLVMLVLIARLYYLQVMRGSEFTIKSESNFVQLRRVMHDRGAILDRAGRVLVDNRPAHDLYLTPAFVPDSLRMLRALAGRIDVETAGLAGLDRLLLTAQEQGDTTPVLLARGVEREQVAELQRYIAQERLLGVEIQEDPGCTSCSQVLLQPQDFPSTELVIRRLAEALGVPLSEMDKLRADIHKAKGLERFVPIRVERDIPWDAYADIEARASLYELPGVDIQHTQRRRYRYAGQVAHVLGYINEISERALERMREDGYRMGDDIGQAGLELSFERELRGIDGNERVVVDAKGRRMDERRSLVLLGDQRGEAPQPGRTLVLSIDAELQQVAQESFEAMEGRAGAVVAVEAQTGFILAMASFPAYDPNVVSSRLSAADKVRLDTDRLQPWFNKAVQQHYPPGSTFKVATALAGLRSGVINTTRRINCPGAFRLGSSVWRCWALGGHGPVELVRAIQKSCDVFFYNVGFEVGVDALADAAKLLGFGTRTGIDLQKESPGFIATRRYYESRLGGYQKGFVVNNAIGQGDITVTPLQLAMAYAALGNGGTLHAPQLVREIRDHEGNVVHHFEPIVRWRLPVPSETIQIIQQGLSAVVQPGGTAYGLYYRREPEGMADWLRRSAIPLAGKTGTAQVMKMGTVIKKMSELDYWERDHAWFAAYAPAEHPEIAVAVVNEHSGHGGSHAAPIAANVIRAYFERVRPREKQALQALDEELELAIPLPQSAPASVPGEALP